MVASWYSRQTANCESGGCGARSGGIKSKWLPLGGSSPHERRRASFQNSVSRDRNSPLIFDSRWSPCWWSTWWWTSCLSSACCLRPDEDGGHAGPSGDLQICSELSVYLPIVPTVSDKSSSKIFFWSILIYISDLLKSFTIHNSFTAILFRDCSKVISMIFYDQRFSPHTLKR